MESGRRAKVIGMQGVTSRTYIKDSKRTRVGSDEGTSGCSFASHVTASTLCDIANLGRQARCTFPPNKTCIAMRRRPGELSRTTAFD